MDQRKEVESFFHNLRDRILTSLEELDEGKFHQTHWKREEGGGGVMSLMEGKTFEKVGVNCSTVFGKLDPAFSSQLPGNTTEFFATGISFVAHPYNPMGPTSHMNLRYLETDQWWFGGGADLTPFFPFEEDTQSFHRELKSACDQNNPEYYPKFKKWCDEYFYLPHRKEPRGVGGIFFDYLQNDVQKDFQFVKTVGEAFLKVYPQIIKRRKDLSFTPEQKEHQLYRRGRYVEFNLIYDRGTQFGLKTGGNVEAIFMSLPPTVKWK
ncbi:MAG TPA: oxygen-dependent coproporphyrinogen oxidase [Nitrospiria bacterium]|jgi:coproporphyrinogen III oxidase